MFIPSLNNPALKETGNFQIFAFDISRNWGSYRGTCTHHINISHIVRNSYFEGNTFLF
jgi:hypothetical protein